MKSEERENILVAGVDGGGSKTRLILADGTGHALATVTGDGSAVDPKDAKRSATIIAELAGEALEQVEMSRETISTLCAGVAGAGAEDAQKALTRALKATDVAEEIIVTTDAQIALEDAFGDSSGIVLIAGTGSVAFGRSPTDVLDRCGGWGPMLGDEGSALWLVRRALNAATAAADGREPETALLGALMTTTECADATDLIKWVANASNADIAALAPVVLKAAEAGDLRANTVSAIAAEELVMHVRTLARRLFLDERAAVSVAFSGGLLARGSLMRKLVEHRMRSAVPGAQVRHEDVDAARGAVRRALKGAVAICALFLTLATSAMAQGRGGRGNAQYLKFENPVVALTHARVIDGTGTAAKTDQTIIIRNGTIDAFGSSASVTVPSDALIVDLNGKTAIPGLVMVHEHLYYPNGGGWYGNYDESFSRLYLAGGVTSMRTAGNVNGYTDLALKQQIDAGTKPGPWIDATAPYLQGPGGVAGQLYILKNADDARRMVNFWADAGATSFKAYMNITRDELRAAIEEAHKRNLKVTGHLCSVTYREAAEMGIDNLEHGFFVSTDFFPNKTADVCPGQNPGMQTINALDTTSAAYKSLVQYLIQKKVALTSTLTVFETFTPGRPMPAGQDVLEPSLKESFQRSYDRTAANPNNMYATLYPKAAAMEVSFVRAGGMLVAGTDPTGSGGVIPGYANQRAVELLVEAGLSPVEAIKVCTLNGATYLGRADKVGSIAVGKQADIIVLTGDPTTTIGTIRNVEIVFKNGQAFDPAKLIASVRGRVGVF